MKTLYSLRCIVRIIGLTAFAVVLVQPSQHIAQADTPNARAQANLSWNVDQINAGDVWKLGITGKNVTVALVDTGIDDKHPDLADDIVDQHCFDSSCANPNKAPDSNGHGTHVAGIITSQGTASPRGIAPDANIVAIHMGTTTQSVVTAIDWVVTNQARLNIKIINIAAAAGLYSGECDTADTMTRTYAEAITRAQQAGIIVFATAGSGSDIGKISAPACISDVISVSGTNRSDRPVFNSGSALDLLAPGVEIDSTAPGGGHTTISGSSHASPHAAAVAALMLEANPRLTSDEIEAVLKETGVQITDPRNNRVKPRIDALAAVRRVMPSPPTPTPTATPVPATPTSTATPVPATPTTEQRPAPSDGSFADAAFRAVWERTDLPVVEGVAGLKSRSWIWGPQPLSAGAAEAYAEGPGGRRLVQYFDKSRMEINNPAAPRDQWYVTNGLLVVELITGRMQTGNSAFEARAPSDEAVAGDPSPVNPTAPTYRSFRSVAHPANAQRAPQRVGQIVTTVLMKDGEGFEDIGLARYNVMIGAYDETLGHNIPQVFSSFFLQQGLIYEAGSYVQGQIVDPLFVVGLPISEPYWSRVKVGGVEKDVLMQAFERRVLTYTPENVPDWRVEMGNVGQHYLRWRYEN